MSKSIAFYFPRGTFLDHHEPRLRELLEAQLSGGIMTVAHLPAHEALVLPVEGRTAAGVRKLLQSAFDSCGIKARVAPGRVSPLSHPAGQSTGRHS